ncbi:rhamnan synthesis F family protein [Enterococcus gallinarum]|uniref:Glycosyltransferases involved in cell wall biogenesis n=1 Tax=Enterococcus gallinarum TaxID=1353 RepID=A0A376GYU9_ENTGA|nr:rhamnan synthesis F family protein [Enterococcus gallinarum]MDT2686673.1 rhamnan synthesis F family protein [Enterococcus gallinarum]MDT2689490.1 rhamnan synthesis F family protein [Enterococcus gallinarum]STD72529.1 Glycosyltransferases involved in cell wall biogenesis [Enterococcus gallinarum]STD82842.1 Glycosyltransferases involved in cell wall biogenesis [Enterococcus gallinarum]
MDPLVSVIVTCYNHDKYVRQCLASVSSQTYKNLELLIINDGSTDNSDHIIKNFLAQVSLKYNYLVQDNSGVCVTRNKGLERASGDYILFVDSDNYLDNDYIEKLVEVAEKEKADIVYTDLVNVDNGEIFMEAKPFQVEDFLASNFIDNCSLIRKKIVGDLTYDLALNRKKLVDYDFFMRLILTNHAKAVKCQSTKLNYRVLEKSISRKGQHGTEKFYYEIYLYLLSKHQLQYPDLVMSAIKKNIMQIEDRYDELLNHLGDLTEYIHNQNKDNEFLISEIYEIKKSFEKKAHENQMLAEQLNEETLEKNELKNQNASMTQLVQLLEADKQAIISSKSYKIGNFFVKPFSYGLKLIKNPRKGKVLIVKVKQKILLKLRKIPSLKFLFLSNKRKLARKKNNYENPKRALIYVIYESQTHLQDYKTIFLSSLAQLSEKVLIVVNGELPDSDLERLRQFGEVSLRSNEGYDTAAFKHGIKYLGEKELKKYDELLLVNDTNVGPISDLSSALKKMATKNLDFWGISYGEEQPDFTKFNKYGYIPLHLQSYFLVIEKSLFHDPSFYDYWENLGDTNSREKAIGKHETVFTKYFSDLGFKHGALTENNTDSPMYIHPLQMVKEGVPIIKYTAFANYTDEKFAWQGLKRKTEIPELIEYIKSETDYPITVINQIMEDVKNKKHKEHILIIDGVENAIPQLTKYRVQNKVEQLINLGFDVWHVNLSTFQMGLAEHASHIIIYRAPYDDRLVELIRLARKYHKPVLYDIDDLVIDTKYTDQLTYVQNLSKVEKNNYDSGVISYKKMMLLCDGAIASTGSLKNELFNYQKTVLLNRNLANQELVKLSQAAIKNKTHNNEKVKIGYFSGSITHNENFELIKPAILKILEIYPQVELHLVGHLDIPKEMEKFDSQLVIHPFVDWKELPKLISEINVNLAPLVQSVFNEAKSEIKWLEAALVQVPTLASDIGAFKEMIIDHETGFLAKDNEWFEKLERMINDTSFREQIGKAAYEFVLKNCSTEGQEDELSMFLRRKC